MRKRYIPDELGREDEYWDRNWRESSIEAAVQYCEIDPLRPVFEKYFPKSGKILEAGCGLGQYVFYYRRQGYDIEGVDFAQETIKRILEYNTNIPVQVADVRRLPYPDAYFDAYYSGGVVEHFEEGPCDVLREAYRVLKKEAILIVTVPYLNITRRVLDFLTTLIYSNSRGIKNLLKNQKKYFNYLLVNQYSLEPKNLEGLNFIEYYHRKGEIVRILQNLGFEVVETKPFSIMWGIQDLWIFRLLLNTLQKQSNPPIVHNVDQKSAELNDTPHGIFMRIKSLLVSERSNLALFKGLIFVLSHLFAHMILLVCRKV